MYKVNCVAIIYKLTKHDLIVKENIRVDSHKHTRVKHSHTPSSHERSLYDIHVETLINSPEQKYCPNKIAQADE